MIPESFNYLYPSNRTTALSPIHGQEISRISAIICSSNYDSGSISAPNFVEMTHQHSSINWDGSQVLYYTPDAVPVASSNQFSPFTQDPLNIPIMAAGNPVPQLVIVNQPESSFRFRYESEVRRETHGSLMGQSSDPQRKESIRVQLRNSPCSEVGIRCMVVTSNGEPHVHRLGRITAGSDGNAVEVKDHFDVTVSAVNNWTATFEGLSIVRTRKRDMHTPGGRLITRSGPGALDLHIAMLQFRAFTLQQHAESFLALNQCLFVNSQPIRDARSSNDLVIKRVSKVSGFCSGGEEVFILVSKVDKRNIQIRFYETDAFERVTWTALAHFLETDVHHQVAIVFRTPAYRDTRLQNETHVQFELYRQSDGCRSTPKSFVYLPNPELDLPERNQQAIVNPDFMMIIDEFIPEWETDSAKPLCTGSRTNHHENQLVVDKHGNNILHNIMADAKRTNRFHQLLLRSHTVGKLLNRKNYDGLTPLHVAIQAGNKAGVQVLLAMGADVNAQECKRGWTALHMAVERHDEELVKLLLTNAAIDLEAQSYDGIMAYQLAQADGKCPFSIRCVLPVNGADVDDESSASGSECDTDSDESGYSGSVNED